MVKLEYPGVSQNEQQPHPHPHQHHMELAQDMYHNQSIGSLGSSYGPIGYFQTQHGMMQPIAAGHNPTFMPSSHTFTAISEKPIAAMGLLSPIIAAPQSQTQPQSQLQPLPLQPMPEILHRDAIITSTQSHIQSQLQRKHEELQQLIIKQQEEVSKIVW